MTALKLAPTRTHSFRPGADDSPVPSPHTLDGWAGAGFSSCVDWSTGSPGAPRSPRPRRATRSASRMRLREALEGKGGRNGGDGDDSGGPGGQ